MPDKVAMITPHPPPLHTVAQSTPVELGFLCFFILNQIQNYNIMEGRGEVLAFFRPMIPFSNPLALQ